MVVWLSVSLSFLALGYVGVLLGTSWLAPYRLPMPFAVPIFDTPFVLVALGIGYLCLERHRVRQDVPSAALGAALWLSAALGIVHIAMQPDYPGRPGVDPASAPYYALLSFLTAFVGVAVAVQAPRRTLVLTDRARAGAAVGVFTLAAGLVAGVTLLKPLLPSVVMAPGRFTPFAVWTGALTIGAVAAWVLAGVWAARREMDVFTRLLALAAFVWLIGIAGFLVFPYRYSIPWYVVGLSRPLGVILIFVGLMREQVSLYREITHQNRELAAREQVARASASTSEQRFRDLVQDLDAIVWEANREGRPVFISQRAESILGYPVARWLSDPTLIEAHVHPEDRARVIDCLRRVMVEGGRENFEYRAVGVGGDEHWLRSMIHVTHTPAGEVQTARGLMVDITTHKALEQQLQQAQKMEAVGRLAGGVAHDFNNLLTVIMTQTELLGEQLAAEESLARDVEVIQRTAFRGAELTRQLMSFGRKQVFQPRVLDVNDLVVSTGAMLRRVIGEDITVVTLLAPGLWPVQADPGQLEQVIMNLAVNARDAMPQGGRLTMETANVEVDALASRRHAVLTEGDYTVLTVSDTGCGMDADTQARMFEPFFTTKPKGKGTGLGLFTVYGIVKQCGGTIHVDSALGHGTTIRLYLPRAAEVPAPADVPRVATPTRQGSETVLLVEDETEVRRLARQTLERNGYVVLEAGDGVEALRVSARHQERIDLLLTDVVMPRMGGRELAERLAARYPGLKVLFMSGYTDDVVVRRTASEHPLVFLQKPFTSSALASKVREVIDTTVPQLSVF